MWNLLDIWATVTVEVNRCATCNVVEMACAVKTSGVQQRTESEQKWTWRHCTVCVCLSHCTSICLSSKPSSKFLPTSYQDHTIRGLLLPLAWDPRTCLNKIPLFCSRIQSNAMDRCQLHSDTCVLHTWAVLYVITVHHKVPAVSYKILPACIKVRYSHCPILPLYPVTWR